METHSSTSPYGMDTNGHRPQIENMGAGVQGGGEKSKKITHKLSHPRGC